MTQYKGKVIVDGDSKGDSFLIALSCADGGTLWRVNRTRRGISYSAPLIREMAGRTQLVSEESYRHWTSWASSVELHAALR